MAWSNVFSLEDMGHFIQRERRSRGIGQQEFAKDLGVARSTLSSLENGAAVSSRLLFLALSLLGLRLVVAPRSADVVVTLATQQTEGG